MLPPYTFLGTPVLSLQYMLREISFLHPVVPRLIPDGIFGERTLEAVMIFQREFHPPVTGTVNQDTWEAIVSTYQQTIDTVSEPRLCQGFPDRSYTIQPGERCIHLHLIQSMFNSLSYSLEEVEAVPVTGNMDEKTVRNTRWLQRLNMAEETGIMDKDTWNTLTRLYTVFVLYTQTPQLTRPELFWTP